MGNLSAERLIPLHIYPDKHEKGSLLEIHYQNGIKKARSSNRAFQHKNRATFSSGVISDSAFSTRSSIGLLTSK
ncbi:MAG: hypothetical protein Q8910_16945 [Bacteroidota bacterium]|nr:hypothetical protein [Bacteroidota bacterium]